MRLKQLFIVGILTALIAALPSPARAQAVERLCDPGNEDCRQILINYIKAETVGLDLAFWFMEDSWIASEVINRHKAGVPVRVLMDTQANASTPRNIDRLAELQAAGVPMREKVTGGILHWKMMLFAGQNIVEFSGANFSSDAWLYSGAPYTNYVDEAIYFTSDNAVVNSFRTKFDDLWVNTTGYANYANVTGPLVRNYGVFPKDPELNFPPLESFAERSVQHYNAEQQKLDVIIYRITDQRHTNGVIAAVQRGIPVRLITEPLQYRDPNRLWHSWNIDRLYTAGVQIRNRAHAGLNHQKLTLYYSQGISVLGSSNWTSPSDNSQEEHNYFTTKLHLFTWLVDHFERKWNNSAGVAESAPFTPLPPDAATAPSPASGAQGLPTTAVTLKWHAGYWAHNYDIYFGTTPQPPLLAADQMLGPSQSSIDYKQFTVPTALQPGTTYYWRIVSKTMANMTASSQVFSFTTEGATPPPPPPPPPDGTDVVLHAGKGTRFGAWQVENDATAASGVKMRQPDAGAPKLPKASATPANYFELTFTADAGVAYRLWVRGRADNNSWPNDSAFVQFSGSVDSGGSPMWRIGTTSATEVSLEECSSCGVSNWGWQDNGWGAGVLGPLVYFATTGTQKIRVQTREDGFAIDQIVLSRSAYLTAAPGPQKNDNTILPEQGGGGTTPPPGDTTNPTAQITSPANGATVSGTVSVAATATDNVGVSRVELLVDGAQIASDSSAPYQFSWNTAALSNGTHTLQARAVDAASNAGLSSTLTVTVNNTVTPPPDTTVPTAQITSPSNGATVSGTVNVAVTAADNVAVSRVELLVDGTQVASDTSAPYQFSWNTAALSNGTHTLQARAVDAASNAGLSSIVSVTVNNTVTPPSDTTAPTAQITSPANGATVSATANVAVTAADNVAVSRVELLLDGVLVATDSAAPYQFAWDTSGTTNGSHTLRARAVDSSNNTGLSAIITVTVSNTATPSEEIVLWTANAVARVGNWQLVSDTTAAGGLRIHNPDGGAAKITTASATPVNYFEVTFNAVAGKPYRIWMRGKAEANYWANDSVFLQFNGSVDSSGANIWRIGTTSAAEYNLEEASGFGVSEWGWQDNGWGAGVLGPVVYFKTTGPQTLRIQVREDGLSLDQIVLSPSKYLSSAPGPSKNDNTILGKTQ